MSTCNCLAVENDPDCNGHLPGCPAVHQLGTQIDAEHPNVYVTTDAATFVPHCATCEQREQAEAELVAARRRIAKLEIDERRLHWLFLWCTMVTRALRDDNEPTTIISRAQIDKALAAEDAALRGAA